MSGCAAEFCLSYARAPERTERTERTESTERTEGSRFAQVASYWSYAGETTGEAAGATSVR